METHGQAGHLRFGNKKLGLLRRFRAIAMTTLAAILTLMPLALAIGEGSAMQQPLAVTIIAGLIAQLPLVLFVMPSLYALLGRLHPSPSGASPPTTEGGACDVAGCPGRLER